MKKRLWFLVLPIVLFGAALWAKQAAWNRLEDDFRHDVRDRVGKVKMIYAYAAFSVKFSHFGTVLNKPDLLRAIDKTKLIRARSPHPFGTQMFQRLEISLENNGITSISPAGFYLSLEEDRGWVTLPTPPYRNWDSFELAPETCRALKKQILGLKYKSGEF